MSLILSEKWKRNIWSHPSCGVLSSVSEKHCLYSQQNGLTRLLSRSGRMASTSPHYINEDKSRGGISVFWPRTISPDFMNPALIHNNVFSFFNKETLIHKTIHSRNKQACQSSLRLHHRQHKLASVGVFADWGFRSCLRWYFGDPFERHMCVPNAAITLWTSNALFLYLMGLVESTSVYRPKSDIQRLQLYALCVPFSSC